MRGVGCVRNGPTSFMSVTLGHDTCRKLGARGGLIVFLNLLYDLSNVFIYDTSSFRVNDNVNRDSEAKEYVRVKRDRIFDWGLIFLANRWRAVRAHACGKCKGLQANAKVCFCQEPHEGALPSRDICTCIHTSIPGM